MRTLVYSIQFRHDVKRAEKRRKDLGKLKTPDHAAADWCPVAGDVPRPSVQGRVGEFSRRAYRAGLWLLSYKIDGTVLRLERTGTHTDLFEA